MRMGTILRSAMAPTIPHMMAWSYLLKPPVCLIPPAGGPAAERERKPGQARWMLRYIGDPVGNSREASMTFLVWLLLGVVIGYLGSLIMRSDADRGAVLSTAAGIVGALLFGRLLALFGGGAPGKGFFTLTAVLVSLLGAVILVALVNLLRRGRLR